MAKTRRTRSTSSATTSVPSVSIPINESIFAEPSGPRPPETTGRFVVTFRDNGEGDHKTVKAALHKIAGIAEGKVASAADFLGANVDADEIEEAEALYFNKLGIAVVSADNPAVQSLTASAAEEESHILAVEPEYIFHTCGDGTWPFEYLRGYRDAVNHLYDQLTGRGEFSDSVTEAIGFIDNAQFTWGLQATGVANSPFSGQNIKIAVLDTGMDMNHPDFAGRPIVGQSFVAAEPIQDLHGHGTHCIGTACGPKQPASGVRRYGCAFSAQIFAGKVLSNGGSGPTAGILAGMNWAITNGCQIISMSLGADVQQVSPAYENAGRRALNAGCLIIAAAGNNADRRINPPNFGFVGQPANSTTIMAVGAIDSNLRIAFFSARSGAGAGGSVDIAAPGLSVFSTVPMPTKHGLKSGTSMATPHVAGIAALWAQARNVTGMALWNTITRSALRLNIPNSDVGTGLVQAPSS